VLDKLAPEVLDDYAPWARDLLHRGAAVLGADAGRRQVNLLACADVAAATGGRWGLVGEALFGESAGVNPAEWAVLPLAYAPPEEYDLTAVVERVEGRNALWLGLAAGGRQFHLAVDAHGGEWTGLVELDGSGQPDRADAAFRRPLLRHGHKSTLTCEVRRGGVRVLFDGHALFDYQGGFERLALQPAVRLPDRRCLFLGAVASTYRIYELRLEPVRGTGEALDWGRAGPLAHP
jgi:hypothetical protein